jgi:hypothetical protein
MHIRCDRAGVKSHSPVSMCMKMDPIRTNIINITFVFIFLFGFGFEYG